MSHTGKSLIIAMGLACIENVYATEGPGTFRDLPLSNPYTSFLPAGAEPNYEYWTSSKVQGRRLGRNNEDNEPAPNLSSPNERVYVDIFDSESLDEKGRNDNLENAIQLNGDHFRLKGRLYIEELGNTRPQVVLSQSEDDDVPAQANPLEITATNHTHIYTGVLGDGAQGESDYDVYHVTNLNTDHTLSIGYRQNDQLDRDYRAVMSIFDSNFERLSTEYADDGYFASVSLLEEEHDELYLALGYYSISNSEKLLDSAQHNGQYTTPFSYQLKVEQSVADEDIFSFYAEAGQVISVSQSNRSMLVELRKEDKRILMGGIPGDLVFPENGLLPRNGANDFAWAVEESGRYNLRLKTFGVGQKSLDYEVKLSILDSSNHLLNEGEHQIIFLDFDGATLNGRIFNGIDEIVTLSPLSSFIQDFGLSADQQDALIREVCQRVENKIRNVLMTGASEKSIQFTNSLDHPDTFGEKNVSRLIIGGTINELRYSTIGVAQSIDVGNYAKEETGVVLLDLISDESYEESVHNINNESTHFDLVAETISVIAAHELGHILSAFHTDNENDVLNIMDAGGDLHNHLGVGEDRIFGTDDDTTVIFTKDEYDPSEFFLGNQSTDSIVRNALKVGQDHSSSSDDDDEGFLGLGNIGLFTLILLMVATRKRLV